jgi:hypothetical protein
VTDILSLIDNAVEDYETSYDAMRWAPERPRHRRLVYREGPPSPPRRPVVEANRPGCRLVPFIGGPCDGDLRAMRLPLDWHWLVAEPVPVTFASFVDDPVIDAGPQPVCYSLRRVANLPPHWPMIFGWFGPWPGTAEVYAASEVSEAALNRAVCAAVASGWRPWTVEPVPMPVEVMGHDSTICVVDETRSLTPDRRRQLRAMHCAYSRRLKARRRRSR